MNKNIDDEIYYNRELIMLSKEKRQLDLITISSTDQITSLREPSLKNLFPNSKVNYVRPFQ